MDEEIEQLAKTIAAHQKQAIRITLDYWQPEVDDIVGNNHRDPKRIEQGLDALLGVAFDDQVLLVFKKLCRHYWQIDPHATAFYINSYREMWDNEE